MTQWFSTSGSFAPWETFAESGDIFGCYKQRRGAPGFQGVEGGARRPAAHGTAPITTSYPALSDNRTEAEQPALV